MIQFSKPNNHHLFLMIFTCAFLFVSFSSYAQALPRKVKLGATITQTNEGVEVVKVHFGSAENIKLLSGDVILDINKEPVKDDKHLIEILERQNVGATANLTVLRNGKKVKLKGALEGIPRETSDFYEVIYDRAPYKGGELSVIINKPTNEGKMPAMLFIPGYTCSSIDNLSDNHPYKRIIDAYAKAGFVTLRIEKSGLGDSRNTPACESCDLKDEIVNFQVGLDKLKSLPYVDTNKIIIFGHSMGGIVAPALSAKNSVAGVIVYGTTAKSWFEYQIEMYRTQNLLAGLDPLTYEQSVVEQYELNYRYFVKKESLTDLAQDPHFDSLLQVHWGYDGDGKIFSRNAEYWRQIQDMPHLEHWKNTTAKVLVQFGESDFQAFSLPDHQQIVRTVNYYHSDNASLLSYPLTDHFFAQSGTMQEAYDTFIAQEYLKLFDAYNENVGNDAVQWSLSVINDEKNQKANELTWKKLNTEPYLGKQDDIYFIDENTGWYVNGFGKIYKTQNGGSSWEMIHEKQGSFFRTIAFVDENIGFVGTVGTDYFPNVSDTIPLYKTIDGGLTWKPVDYSGPYVKGLCAIDIVIEPYINHGLTDYKTHIFAVGRVGSPANMLVSNDGGETWMSKSMNDDCKMLFDIQMFDKNNGIACAASSEHIALSNALILKTSDGGNSWSKVYQSTRPFETTWKVSFPTPMIGYVTIQSYHPDPSVKQQRIAKTTDGGNTWQEIDLVEDHAARQFGIGFVTENHGFVGTVNSGYETLDGGKTWRPIDLGRACNKIRIYKEDNKVFGYAIGVDVFKLESTSFKK